jgi:hypothetical protein
MRRERIAVFTAVLLLGGALALPARATISEALSLRDLVREAQHVVLATAVDARVQRDARGRIVTDYTVRVEDVMKGDARGGGTLVMRALGGAIGDIGMHIEGEPELVLGERYVLFLHVLGDARTLRPVGMSQGVMPVEQQGSEEMVHPGGAGLALTQRARGQLVPAPAALLHPEPYAQLRDRVGQVVATERSGTVAP